MSISKQSPAVAAAARKRIYYDDSTTGGQWLTVDKDQATEYLSNLAEEIWLLKDELTLSIGAAIGAGMTWAEVGKALGVSRQGAQQAHKTARSEYEGFAEGNPEGPAALLRRIGASYRRIVFEVRVREGEAASRHHKIGPAREAARKAGEHAEIWKVYPDGAREIQVG